MGTLFGTDGIRGVAGRYPMTVEMALKIGRAVAAFCTPKQPRPKIVIGQDTRQSGDMLAHALMAGICSHGGDACLLGVLPTPAVAQATVENKAAAGVMISASHNPFQDNGIKIFDHQGFKLDDDQEFAIESMVLARDENPAGPDSIDPGRVVEQPAAVDRYIEFLKKGRLHPDTDLSGFQVVLDCAHGATFEAAPRLFETLGVAYQALNTQPDGSNINTACGSQHPEKLAAAVRAGGAHAGLAFDGDGDRIVAVDETGRVLSGDTILAICAHHLKLIGKLPGNVVVSTVMSNLGLGLSLADHGIKNETTGVGDRLVMRKMKASGAAIGGEDSGHLIFRDHHTTGDGILSGLRLLEIMAHESQKLSQLTNIITIFPQTLINIDTHSKPPLESVPEISATIDAVEAELGDQGRVLVRYSGTQSCCRVMVEGPTEQKTRSLCRQIADVIAKQLGVIS